MTKDALTLPQIAKRAGVQYRTLHSWVERGMLRPSVFQSSGSGRPNLFSERDAHVAEGLAALRSRGLGIEALELVAAEWRQITHAVCPTCGSDIDLESCSGHRLADSPTKAVA